ncbi:MAG: hypothetical protein KIT79_13445 [Deltaproteobacteria bacterium]|nr:hypothetical protein [Deltaproteobacteria bacterium]
MNLLTFVQKLSRPLFAAAILVAAVAACGSDGAPGEVFLPGDYVIGVVVTSDEPVGPSEIGDYLYGFGYGEITVAEDGEITGTAEFTVAGGDPDPVSLPDGEGFPAEITGTVTGTAYEMTIDIDGGEYTSTGTITAEGALSGDFEPSASVGSPLNGMTGGVIQQGELAVACGGFMWGDQDDPRGVGSAIYLLNGDTLFGVFGGTNFQGLLTADVGSLVEVCDVSGCGEAEGVIEAKIDETDFPATATLDVDMGLYASETPGGTYMDIDGGSADEGDDILIFFGGDTESCFGEFMEP